MKPTRTIAVALLACVTLTCVHAGIASELQDPQMTPGVVRNDLSLEEICSTAWGKDKRMVSDAMKKRVDQEYASTLCPSGKAEIDHLLSRELGGADAVGNLWKQCYEAKVLDPDPKNTVNFDPATHQLKAFDPKNPPADLVYLPPSAVAEFGAHKKDRLEDDLGRRICLPASDPNYISLATARNALSSNWVAAYIERYGDPRAQAAH